MVLLQKTSIQWKRITSNDERLILERYFADFPANDLIYKSLEV